MSNSDEEKHLNEDTPNKKESTDEKLFVPPSHCQVCDNEPCIAIELEQMLMSIFHTHRDSKTNREIRFTMYTNSVKEIYGPSLGKGVRKKLPHCLQMKIRSIVPDKKYTGFKKS